VRLAGLLAATLINAIVPAALVASGPISDANDEMNILTLHLNRVVILGAGLRVAITDQALPTATSTNYGQVDYAFKVDPLGITVVKGVNAPTPTGSFQSLGGLLFMAGALSIDLRPFVVRPVENDPTRWEIFDAHGGLWLLLDHAHPDLDAALSHLGVLHANVRLSKAFASRIDQPELADSVVGGADFRLTLGNMGLPNTLPQPQIPVACRAPWASKAAPAKIRMILGSSTNPGATADTIAFERCLAPDRSGHLGLCTGSLLNGRAVFAPDASLVNEGSSAIPWHGMFTGAFPPYGNDQPPYLVWNLYRIDADGTFRQLGRSGVKHAFYAVNSKCPCPGGNVVYPHCEDVYSSFSNDSLEFVGPRAEVLPAKGIWGRCGSVFDSDCDGRPGPRLAGQDDGLLWRMAVPETNLSGALHPGAVYLFEYGYLARDRDATTSPMAYRIVHPLRSVKSTGQVVWRLDPEGLMLGSALDAWIKPNTTTPYMMRRPFHNSDGSGSVAVRISRLGAHRYKYVYAIQNLDLAHALISGDATNPRIVDPQGIARIEIAHAPNAAITHTSLIDASGSPSDLWTNKNMTASIIWQVDRSDQLTWGSVYSVSLVSDTAPTRGTIRLSVGEIAQPISVETLVPSSLKH
jgi:hypothetical protein